MGKDKITQEDLDWLNFDEGNLEPYDWGDINPDEIGEKIEWQ